MAAAAQVRDPYLVKSVLHSSQILLAFRSSGETLRLREICARSGLPKSMAFRLLYTLDRCGMVEKVGENLYRSCLHPVRQRSFRLGYAAQGTDYQFTKDISSGLERAAANHGVELISLDNRYSARTALRNADLLVREKVDLAIEFQTDDRIAPVLAAKYREAQIPMIAIDIPHPGAIYYGANNYEAGFMGGRHMGRWIRQHWQSEFDELILLELTRAGNLPRMRLTGLLAGIRETLPRLDTYQITYLDGDGQFSTSLEAMRNTLRTSRPKRFAIGAVNDSSALGALRAFQEAGRLEMCAIMGQNASPEGRLELREPGTRFIGSVAYFPERYGEDLVRIALDLLNGRDVPPALFVKHQLVTPDNVDHYYPNDCLRQLYSCAV